VSVCACVFCLGVSARVRVRVCVTAMFARLKVLLLARQNVERARVWD
jgi:hypothetical protein